MLLFIDLEVKSLDPKLYILSLYVLTSDTQKSINPLIRILKKLRPKSIGRTVEKGKTDAETVVFCNQLVLLPGFQTWQVVNRNSIIGYSLKNDKSVHGEEYW